MYEQPSFYNTKLYMPSSSDSLHIVIIPRGKYRFFIVAIFYYIKQWNEIKTCLFLVDFLPFRISEPCVSVADVSSTSEVCIATKLILLIVKN